MIQSPKINFVGKTQSYRFFKQVGIGFIGFESVKLKTIKIFQYFILAFRTNPSYHLTAKLHAEYFTKYNLITKCKFYVSRHICILKTEFRNRS